MDGCGLVFLLVIVVATVMIIAQAGARKKARRAYREALERLKRDPGNPNLREEALSLGRAYASVMRNWRGVAIFDEVALSNDIGAACAGAFSQQFQASATVAAKLSVEARLTHLAALKSKGLIDDAEYGSRRGEILKEI